MIEIRIDNRLVNLEDVDESWITQQINRRKDDGFLPCVKISINHNEYNMILSTPNCSNAGGGGRKPTENELRIFELWAKFNLNTTDFSGGNLNAFLKQLRRIL